MTTETVKTSVEKRKGSYIGRITVYAHGKRIWSRSTRIRRLNRADAHLDAHHLMLDMGVIV